MAKWMAKPEEVQVQDTEKFLKLGKHSKVAARHRAAKKTKDALKKKGS